MAESDITLNPGTGGERIRTRTDSTGRHEQAVYRPGEDTFYVYSEATIGPNKFPIVLNNAAGSGVFIQCRKLFCTNITAANVVVQRFDIKRGTSVTAGTALTPVKADSLNANLPAQVTAWREPTAMGTETLLFPWMTVTTAHATTQPLTTAMFQQGVNILMESDTVQEFTLQPGEVFGVKQNGGTAAGTLMGWTLVFTVTSLA
jgi:hypothetical protein